MDEVDLGKMFEMGLISLSDAVKLSNDDVEVTDEMAEWLRERFEKSELIRLEDWKKD